MATVCSFKAWAATRNKRLAIETARERRCCIGFCVFDGKWYVGERDEIGKVCIHLEDYA